MREQRDANSAQRDAEQLLIPQYFACKFLALKILRGFSRIGDSQLVLIEDFTSEVYKKNFAQGILGGPAQS